MTAINTTGIDTGLIGYRYIDTVYPSLGVFFGIKLPDIAARGNFSGLISFFGSRHSLP